MALSGGVDSVALLLALQQLRRRSARWRRFTLRAVHVNHQLRPAARSWEQHCRRLCAALDVPLVVRRVRVPQGPGRSLEAEARQVRYAALTRAMPTSELLLTAHHLDDQLETFLLQLLRGAGVAGLAAMGECTRLGERWLLRPLLSEPRSELETFARASAVAWVDDEGLIDPVTAVSGSGPAYVFLLAELMEQAGLEQGLPPALARQLARETVSGSGALLAASAEDAAQLRKNVTSPGGTTAAALSVLMESDAMPAALSKAIEAATKRSRELAG